VSKLCLLAATVATHTREYCEIIRYYFPAEKKYTKELQYTFICENVNLAFDFFRFCSVFSTFCSVVQVLIGRLSGGQQFVLS
jgi:hypothetical protein